MGCLQKVKLRGDLLGGGQIPNRYFFFIIISNNKNNNKLNYKKNFNILKNFSHPLINIYFFYIISLNF